MDDSRAFSSYSVDDVEAAKTFYRGTLGLSVNEQPQGLGIELRGGGSVFLYPKDDHRPATFTVLNFRVDDIDTAVDELVAKGVTMERYDGFGQDERGIAGGDPRIAWFTDRPETCCRFCRCDPVASDDYHFVTEWRVAGTIAEVKDVLATPGR